LIAVKPEVNSVADYFGLPLGRTLSMIGKIGVDNLPNAVRRQLNVSPGRTSSTNIGTIRPESQVNLEP
jgi:hypothetical protein